MDLSNKKVIVIGAGISGFAAAKLAKKLGADVILSDANEKLGEKHDLTELTALDIKVVLGKQTEALFEGADLVIISPAVPRHLPLFEKVAEKVKIIMNNREYQCVRRCLCLNLYRISRNLAGEMTPK